MKPIKIVSYNTYLICNRFNKNRVTHPEKRASKICSDFLSLSSNDQDHRHEENQSIKTNPDLCFFQEVWGSGIQELTKTSDYSSSPRRNSLFSTTVEDNKIIKMLGFESLVGTVKELMDTLHFHWQKTGGLYDFSRPSVTCWYRNKHTFAVSRSRSNKGVEATLWDIPQWCSSHSDNGNDNTEQSKRRLLVFNTHLDPWHVANRRRQIREIFDFIENTLQAIENMSPSTAVENTLQSSLYKGDERNPNGYDWSQTGVLVVGDFNIKAGSKEYWETLEYVKSTSKPSIGFDGWKDYFYLSGESEEESEDQHTYALQNSMVKYPNDCGRIDYIFGIQSFGKPLESGDSTSQQQPQYHRVFMPLSVVSRSIRKEPIGDESSDHYALILEVIPDI
eukprot:CAMPEP_0116081928 /NCGR_PEP_ID=MMETSP0327-20121206/2463_1 /TAXON_ID=44447 /ORGANISM="Pseudo-nitzschia delicatissima, Strain B596" /LENGTH=390 /DNA_ID=CAMNT_0003572705 /DNA_START=216 /DNA_END=1388 /DNA_ORIENTATION=+